MERIDQLSNEARRPWGWLGGLLLLLTGAAAVTYLVVAYLETRPPEAPSFQVQQVGFAILLVLNALFICLAAKLIRTRLQQLDNKLPAKRRFTAKVFARRGALICGLTCGLLFYVVAVYVAGESRWLGGFLFIANIITGMGLYGVFTFGVLAFHLGDHLPVSLWGPTDKRLLRLMYCNRQIAITVAVATAVAISSLILIDVSPRLEWLFAILSLAIVAASYTLPLAKVTFRLVLLKQRKLVELGMQIQKEFAKVSLAAKDGSRAVDTARLDSLQALKKQVSIVVPFPDFGGSMLSTSGSAVLLALVPLLLEQLIRH